MAKLKETVERLKRNEKILKRRASATSGGPSGRPTSAPSAAAAHVSLAHTGLGSPKRGMSDGGESAGAHPNTAKLQELTSRLGQRLENAEQPLAQRRDAISHVEIPLRPTQVDEARD